MREALFLKQNADKWKQYEQDIQYINDPDMFAGRYVELTDDLAYARTFYPNSNVVHYLNGLTSRFYLKIYKNKKEKSSRILTFWKYELPYMFKQYHRQLLYAFLFFIVFCMMGALSAKYDDSFIRTILGDDYVNMTMENIENGDPFKVYKQDGAVGMFLAIAINNIKVAFIAYIWGIFFSVGTIWVLLQNGLMLGSFQYMFIEHDLTFKSILVIFTHGTLEISAIVIAGAAGLIIGNSLLFPKTYSRWHSVMKGAKDALKIVFGLIPVFIVAALLESFVTRHTEMPVILNIFILAASLLFIIWYFIIYPILLHKRIENHNNKLNNSEKENENFEIWLSKKLN